MSRLLIGRSIAARLAVANAAILGATILIMSAVFYFGTVGVLQRGLDRAIIATSDRLMIVYGARPTADLAREVDRELNDGVHGDGQILLVLSASGTPLAGNLSRWPDLATPRDRLVKRQVVRAGRPTSARLIIRPIPAGGLLYVGRDLSEQQSVRRLVWRALRVAAVTALLLAMLGAWLFHRQIANRIGEIRDTARRIEAGNLRSRIAISGDDEFARLSIDINRMLDRIEQLVDGVRHVSNAIAHDLRTPLTRVRGRLDEALRGDLAIDPLTNAAESAIEDIDALVLVFNKLLQIAEAESGLRTEAFDLVDLSGVIQDMVELYDAAADEQRVKLHVGSRIPVLAYGDHDLLANAVASLIDNAIKYAGPGCRVVLFAYTAPEGALIVVQDNGPGVPGHELPRLAQRFYRLDRARSRPGNGLGLGIVSAIATLHGGKLLLANLKPGFQASIILPPRPTASGVRRDRPSASAR